MNRERGHESWEWGSQNRRYALAEITGRGEDGANEFEFRARYDERETAGQARTPFGPANKHARLR